jgi:exonuclease III
MGRRRPNTVTQLVALILKPRRLIHSRKKNGKKMALLMNSFQGNIGVKIAAQNAQSLRSCPIKYQQIETFISAQQVSIMGLSETNIIEPNGLRNRWFKFSPLKNTHILLEDGNHENCQGTALIISKPLAFYIQTKFTLPGRLTGVLIHRKQFKLLVLNVYAPSNPKGKKEQYATMEQFIRMILDRHPNVPTVIIGDFNAAPSPSVDRHPPNITVKHEIPLFSWLQRRNYVDTFRALHPTKIMYSHFAGESKSRIDLCFHKNLTNQDLRCEII